METEVDSDDESSDIAAGIAAVNLSGARKANIRASWSNALIIKVIGKSIGYQFLTSRINNLWKPSGRLDCVDLGKDFFLVRFSLKVDYERVLREGPWFVGGHYLSIRKWEPNFKPSTATVSSVAVWVRLPQLPIEYYEPSVLRDIGLAIGPVLRIDTHTASESRGRFARICVQVNFDHPLIKLIRIGGIEQPVQYEGINALCFSCGRVGHKVDACPYTVRAPCKDGEDKEEGKSSTVKDPSAPTEEVYGPWVLVTRKKHVASKGLKEPAQLSHLGVSYPPKVRAQNLFEGPPNLWSVSTGSLDSDGKQLFSHHAEPSEIVTDHTTKKVTRTKKSWVPAQPSAKHNTRSSRATQNHLVSAEKKENRFDQSLEKKDVNQELVFNTSASNPLVFTAGSSNDTKISMLKESNASTCNVQTRMEGDDAMCIEGSATDPVATASLNISNAVLNKIDPKLRAAKAVAQGNSEVSSDQKAGSDGLPSQCQHEEPLGMQVDGGGEPPTSC